MHILFHHRTRGQGAEGVHIRGVTKGLRELGHTVDILSLPGSEPEEGKAQVQQNKADANKTSFIKKLTDLTKYVPEFIFEFLELAFNLIAYYRVRRSIKSKPTQLVYERYSLFMFATVWYGKITGIPVVFEVNDSCLVHRVRPLFLKSLARAIEKWTFENATGLVFISTYFKNIATQNYPNISPSVISPNAADLDRFVIDHTAATNLRESLSINDKVVLGYVGAFVHWHGIDWFVEDVLPHLKSHPDLVLLLVGDGVCYEPIKSMVIQAGLQSQVILPGRINHEDIPTYIGAMDYGILPDSNDYGSPMKLFEFMAMAKGMVAPDFSPIAEVVNDNETSWLFKANDRTACIDKVLELATRQDTQLAVGLRARDYIETQRQWRHNAEQLLSLVPHA